MKASIKQIALRTIQMEADSISGLASFINEDFEKAIHAIINCKGRVIISGIGKSAVIAQKIVATLNSTGTAASFMHAADAIHGDLGMIQEEDLVIIISKSGSSPEIKVLVPLIKNFGNTLIGMIGNTDSFLAKHSDIVLNTTVEQEACPNNLAPTSSTTAQLVMGDVLAVVLMELKGFNSDDFAKFHPGGTLGKKLYLRVSDLYADNEKPKVLSSQSLKEVIVEITKKRLGATAVVDDQNNLLGIITDGDLRRMLEKNGNIETFVAKDIMTMNPKTIGADELAVVALDMMRKNEITQLVVVENIRPDDPVGRKKYSGIIHLHDLIREGLI
jgi:arabinose-5-phosphate isomerase